jgi:hypothetical protein
VKYYKNKTGIGNLESEIYVQLHFVFHKHWFINVSRIFTNIFYGLLATIPAKAQSSVIDSFRLYNDVRISIDKPAVFSSGKKTIVTFFALPNGNTIEQTMGKKMLPGDDWHFDIQHIRAQTRFIRQQLKANFVVIYLENNYKSWPAWKQNNPDFRKRIPHLVDSLAATLPGKEKEIYLNGHSGGGSFIFGYLAGVEKIPASVKRISFLDSNYGYDSSYFPKLRDWLLQVPGAALNVFAYNDSVALYNGKPVVSPTGGTWYRGHLMLRDMQTGTRFHLEITDSLHIYRSRDRRIQLYFKQNLDRGIYHTQQVELNGFIHSVLCGTKYDSKRYIYYGVRSYTQLIE